MDIQKLFSRPIRGEAPKSSSLPRRNSELKGESFFRQVLFGSSQKNKKDSAARKQENSRTGALSQLFFGSGQKKEPKGDLPKAFQIRDYKEWLKNSKRARAVFNNRLYRPQMVERGMGLFSPKAGAKDIKTEQIKQKRKELEKRYYQSNFMEKIEVRKDIGLLQEYEKELRNRGSD